VILAYDGWFIEDIQLRQSNETEYATAKQIELGQHCKGGLTIIRCPDYVFDPEIYVQGKLQLMTMSGTAMQSRSLTLSADGYCAESTASWRHLINDY
jgi:hypothetical protein